MSSVSRAPGQLSSTVAYLVAVVANTGERERAFYPSQLAGAVADNDGLLLSNVGSVLNTSNASDFIGNVSSCSLPTWGVGDQLRDLGKTLYVEENFMNAYIYKLVQKVDGENTGGVPTNGRVFWALVWAAKDNNLVNLVRSGY